MNVKEARQIDLVDYLSQLGFTPTRVAHPNYWYRSPLREERTASFKVNRKTNTWKDFATNAGGNLVDFGIQYFKCTVADFLRRISGPRIPSKALIQPTSPPNEVSDNAGSSLKILSVDHIVSLPLIRYLRERRISDQVAHQHLKEAVYELKGKQYYALAFQNDKGGYELRNKYFKGSSSPKDSTFIDNGALLLSVFEGFFNFLSFRTFSANQDQPKSNFLVLNSTAFFEEKMSLMKKHSRVNLYLDNDATGQKCSRTAIANDTQKFIDQRSLYSGYNDLNDWLINIGKGQSIRHTP